jgi:two-component system, OmpR family, sensor histidine kinase VicK
VTVGKSAIFDIDRSEDPAKLELAIIFSTEIHRLRCQSMSAKPPKSPKPEATARRKASGGDAPVPADVEELARDILLEDNDERQRVELFTEVTFKIRQSLQLKEILRTTVTEVRRILQADRVLIYQIFPDGTGKPISEAVLPAYPEILGMEFPEEVFPEEYQNLYALGRVRAIADVRDKTAGIADCLVEFVEQFTVKAKLIVPILHSLSVHPPRSTPPQHALWGLLIAHQCDRPRQWHDFELELMKQLADQISIALAQGELWEHLEEIVAERTAELQAANVNLRREIADRKQVELALRESEEQLRSITNALPVLIAYVDDRECYQFNNQAYADWLGKPLEEIRGNHLSRVWGNDCYQRMQPHVRAVLSGQVVTYENEIELPDGGIRSVNVTYIPHRDLEERVKGFLH